MEINSVNNKDFNFNDINSFLVRHKNLVILTTLIFIISTFYYTFTVSPIYKSSTTLLIRDSSHTSSVLDFGVSNSRIEIENEKMVKLSIVNVIKPPIPIKARYTYNNNRFWRITM